MSYAHARWSMLAAWVFCICQAAAAVAADGLPTGGPGSAEPSASVARIEEALAQPAEFEFLEVPLRDVAEFLAETYQIPVYLDAKGLEDAGVTADQPVSVRIKGIKLESALNLVLGQLELDVTIANEVLLITTQEVINNTLETRVYQVADLVEDLHGSNGARRNGFPGLIKLIQVSLQPESWNEVGGPGSILMAASAKSLVCTQTRRVHRKIAALLADLRQAKASETQDQARVDGAAEDSHVVVRFYRIRSWDSPLAGPGAKDLKWESSLSEAIEEMVAPETWASQGGAGKVGAIPGALFVAQSPAIHEQIRGLLDALGILLIDPNEQHGTY